jgi:meso-butanediol dehydrogenase / (S,S)-butanediol dehydrogenase / diacetyl reductase
MICSRCRHLTSLGTSTDVSESDQTDAMIAKVRYSDSERLPKLSRSLPQVVESLGRLDTAVANAGIAEIKPIIETTSEDRRKMLSVNCEGLMNTVSSVAEVLVTRS